MKKNWIYFVIFCVSILSIILFGLFLNNPTSNFLDIIINFNNVIMHFIIYIHTLMGQCVGFFFGSFGEECPLFAISILILASVVIAALIYPKIYFKFIRINLEDFILYSAIICIIFLVFHI